MKRKVFYILAVIAAFAAGLVSSRWIQRPEPPTANTRVLYYVDPMHPAYRSNRPGIAPDCGMELVPVYAKDVAQSPLPAEGSTLGGIHVDARNQQLYGIHVVKAELQGVSDTIRVFGRVAADETRTYRVSVGAEGYVKETHEDATGNHVFKGQHLAVVYAPDMIYAASGYLTAASPTGSGKESSSATPGAAVPQARVNQLRNLGFNDEQIEDFSRTRKVPDDIYLASPVDGFILARNAAPGLRFERRAELYRIADLSKVWVIAEVFGKDAQAFHPGAIARVTLADTGETFQAKVSQVLPQVDAASRTLRVRLECDNPGFKLRPEMLVNIDLPVTQARGLTVPTDALVDSGLAKHVFVETSEGNFEPRDVQVGWRQGDRIQILNGLKEGEKVVSEGTFLIDSESHLKIASNFSRTAASAGER